MEAQAGKILVFDSGLGGLSVLRQLRRLMPQENFLYFGDSAFAPYGTRPTQQVRKLTLARIGEWMDGETKAVVIACNTATAAAIETLRQVYPRQIIIGVEPALKLAAERFPGGRILVMGTEVTLREQKFATLMERFTPTHRIVKVTCPGLVECIEQGQLEGPAVDAVLTRCLGPHLQQPVDAVVLGCTHYPFVRRQIARCVGADAAIFDGGEGTARETMRRLAQRGLLRQGGEGSVTLRNSRSTPEILALSQRLLDLPAL